MKRIPLLKNPVQGYAWGSKTFIPELLGEAAPSANPVAEVWMGAHPKGVSQVLWEGAWVSLADLIQRDPENILGKEAARRFSNRLPFLFKILSAALPLSIQAHPDRAQARQGFARENRLRIPPDDPSRPGSPLRRGLGFALVMQGSGIPGIDMAGAFLKMNEDEARRVAFGYDIPSHTPLPELCRALLQHGPLTACIVTLGEKGAFAVGADSQIVYVPGYEVTVADTCGSGDAFSAATGDPVPYPDAASTGLRSPDGKCLVLTDIDGFWVKPMGDAAARVLWEESDQGEAARPKCWSRDGRWLIGFQPFGSLKGARFVSYPDGQVYLISLPKDAAKEIEKYRQALVDGNPAELWEARGEDLWKKPAGPKNVSLEKCDLGLGPGVVKGAYAKLPRFFKRYQIQPVWRADRPARGRFREFYQVGVEALGEASPLTDAEITSVAAFMAAGK